MWILGLKGLNFIMLLVVDLSLCLLFSIIIVE